jgi:hypothetical protein
MGGNNVLLDFIHVNNAENVRIVVEMQVFLRYSVKGAQYRLKGNFFGVGDPVTL